MAAPTKAEALSLLASLSVGDLVWVLADGRATECTVQQGLHHTDGFGATYSQQVKVGFGPGRWNRQISAETLAAGYVKMKAGPTRDQSYCDLGQHQQCSGYTEDEADPETCMCSCHSLL